jgi:hypothetical protein
MKRWSSLAAGCVVALVMGWAPAADAGAPVAPEMDVNPNPATTEQSITIGNAPGAANTCEGGDVTLTVVKTDGEGAVVDQGVSPDPDGNWSTTIDPIPVAGTFTVSATCTGVEKPDSVQALPDFSYQDVTLVVTQVEPSSSSSSTTSTSASSTSAANGVTTRPSFTG